MAACMASGIDAFRIFFKFYKQNGDITFDSCKILLEGKVDLDEFLYKEFVDTEIVVTKISDDGTYLFVSERSIF